MDYNACFNAIKNNSLSGAYLFHGEEEFVKASALRSAQELIADDMRAFNITVLTDATESEIMDACETLPLFSDKKLVISHGISSSADTDKLVEYLPHIPDSSILIIEIKGALQEKSKLLKCFRAIGHDVEFAELSESEVIKWCMSFAVHNGVALDRNTARTFVGLVGTDMTSVSNELQKAVDMVGEGGVITPDVISKCTIGNIEARIFEMLDCFTGGKVREGMGLLHILLEDENEALGIASFLESRFKLMLEGRRLMDTGLTPTQAAAKMEGSRFANEKACKSAKKNPSAKLASLVSSLADVGYNMMSGGVKASSMIEAIMLTFEW